mmetsp:Transcript_23331/g.72269  ORF Transcript_23331/g.72269 Transcript_23331/m.72269 type:complete len:208 (-) Transcript_23331:249-872(-)
MSDIDTTESVMAAERKLRSSRPSTSAFTRSVCPTRVRTIIDVSRRKPVGMTTEAADWSGRLLSSSMAETTKSLIMNTSIGCRRADASGSTTRLGRRTRLRRSTRCRATSLLSTLKSPKRKLVSSTRDGFDGCVSPMSMPGSYTGWCSFGTAAELEAMRSRVVVTRVTLLLLVVLDSLVAEVSDMTSESSPSLSSSSSSYFLSRFSPD